MSLPPWGTAPGPLTTPDQEYSYGTDPAAVPTVTGSRYVVLIEQTTGSSDNFAFSIEPEPWLLPAGSTREQAREQAWNLARQFMPNHPKMPQGRRIFRLSPDVYLVRVPGLTRTFHFRVSVVEEVD